MTALSESYSSGHQPVQEGAEPQLELVPPVQVDLFDIALHHPVADFEPVTKVEMHAITRLDSGEESVHFLTTTLLRLAGVQTTVEEYSYYKVNEAFSNRLEHRKATIKERKEVQERLTAARAKAAPYIGMLATVKQFNADYQQEYQATEGSPDDRSAFVSAIYDQTEHLHHPGLSYIHNVVQDAREMAIGSERLLRRMLMSDKPSD